MLCVSHTNWQSCCIDFCEKLRFTVDVALLISGLLITDPGRGVNAKNR